MKAALPAIALVLGTVGVAVAETADSPEALFWLKKMSNASRQVNYTGSFVYQHAHGVETSRITHIVDVGGEYEKLETLDGPAREVIRNNDNVMCYLPDIKTVIVEKRKIRHFPVLLPERLPGILDNYVASMGGKDRVAGFECQVIKLEPRDNLRYGHRFCAETASGLPLRARTYNEINEMVESIAFTQVRIGGNLTRRSLRSRYAAESRNWRVERAAPGETHSVVEGGWELKSRPAGFKKLTEMQRSFAGRPEPVAQIVYSDGLAAVSVFIEPLTGARNNPGLSHRGAINIYSRRYADRMITVLGETPAATVMLIGNSITFKGK